jgi:hypothetical protein
MAHARRGVPFASIQVGRRTRRLGWMQDVRAHPMPDAPDDMVDGMGMGVQRRPGRDRRIR